LEFQEKSTASGTVEGFNKSKSYGLICHSEDNDLFAHFFEVQMNDDNIRAKIRLAKTEVTGGPEASSVRPL
jgi:cold shock CspA family protein